MLLTEMFAPRRLAEDEASDRAGRNAAVVVYNIIGENLRAHGWQEVLVPAEMRSGEPGALAIKTDSMLSPPYNDLWVIFEPRGGTNPEANILSDGSYVIYLPILEQPGDASDLANELFDNGDAKDMFVHEFAHYLLLKQDQPSRDASDAKRIARSHTTGKAPKLSQRGPEPDDDRSYFNHPQETQAFYQEATQRVMDMIPSLPDETRKKMAAFTTQRLVKLLRTAFPPTMLDNLTPENRRKLDLRLARFAQQTYRPALVTGGEV